MSVLVFQMTGDYSSMLSIGHASPRHNGNYTCLATNMAASGNLTAAFHVDGKHVLQIIFNPFCIVYINISYPLKYSVF